MSRFYTKKCPKIVTNQVNFKHSSVRFTSTRSTVLSTANMNPCIKEIHYAVRGPIVDRALEIEAEIKEGNHNYDFNEVIKCNIGDCHAMGQQPITLIRQVLAGMLDTSLISSYPNDVQKRVKYLLNACGGESIGSYSASAGLPVIRKHISEYIEKRDNVGTVNPNDIFLSIGASGAIVSCLKLLTYGTGTNRSGIMIPTPQYPLYSATISELDAVRVNYNLDEETNWSLKQEELEKSFVQAKNTCVPRVLCIINPGNPTGNVLSKENIQGIVKFAYGNNLFVMSDEVYQDNIYGENCEFYSFRKILHEMGEPYVSNIQYATFHSISKGYMGECGLRGGYMQLGNWDEDVKTQLLKLLSARLCPTVAGQAAMDCVANFPSQNDESFKLWNKQKSEILSELKHKAKLTADGFNAVDGVSCQIVQGAMYSFPQIKLSEKFVNKCKKENKEPDAVYCMEFLENQGVSVVPGSGFGQKPNTFHFRMTILPPADKMAIVMERFSKFHKDFTKKWECPQEIDTGAQA